MFERDARCGLMRRFDSGSSTDCEVNTAHTDLGLKNAAMIGTEAAHDGVLWGGESARLNTFLQCCFVIGRSQILRVEGGDGQGEFPANKLGGSFNPAIEIDSGEQCFEGIYLESGLASTARHFFTSVEQQELPKFEPRCLLLESDGVDRGGSQF